MTTSPRDLARQVLTRPDEFPPEFVSWLTRLMSNNPRISVSGSTAAVTPTTLRNLAASWSGVLLSVPGLGPTERVPELTGGTGNWTLTKAYFRCETAGTGSTTVVIEKMSPDADSSWGTATTVATLTIPAGHYEVSATISVPVTTGDLLRIRFTSIGTTGLFNVSASAGNGTGGGSGGGGLATGTQLSYNERTTNLIVAGNAAAQDTVIVGDTFTLTGAAKVVVEWYCVQPDIAGTGNMIVELWHNGVDLARWAQFTADPTSDYSWGSNNPRRYMSLAAGAHQFTVKAWTTTPAVTPTLGSGAGTGGNTDYMPMYLRVATV